MVAAAVNVKGARTATCILGFPAAAAAGAVTLLTLPEPEPGGWGWVLHKQRSKLQPCGRRNGRRRRHKHKDKG